jgi:hypothetical protein
MGMISSAKTASTSAENLGGTGPNDILIYTLNIPHVIILIVTVSTRSTTVVLGFLLLYVTMVVAISIAAAVTVTKEDIAIAKFWLKEEEVICFILKSNFLDVRFRQGLDFMPEIYASILL